MQQEDYTEVKKNETRLHKLWIVCGILAAVCALFITLVGCSSTLNSKVKGKTYTYGMGSAQVDIYFVDNENCEITTREISGGYYNPTMNTYVKTYKYKLDGKELYIKTLQGETFRTFILDDNYETMTDITTGNIFKLKK